MSADSGRKARLKETLKKLRAERAERLKAVQARLKDTTALRNKIRKALKDGPRTIPSLAQSIGETTDRTLWMLMEMRNYGQVVEDEQDGDYFKYRLVPVEKKGA
jgi:predicted Rossmann fold nucleotide-binding protein DprA/Smf involved in DNA uptake